MRIPDFQQRLADIGAKPRHIGRMTRAWLKGLPLDVGRRQQQAEDFLPLSVRERLPALSLEIDALARLRSTAEVPARSPPQVTPGGPRRADRRSRPQGAWVMQNLVVGIASRRSGEIGSPQTSQAP